MGPINKFIHKSVSFYVFWRSGALNQGSEASQEIPSQVEVNNILLFCGREAPKQERGAPKQIFSRVGNLLFIGRQRNPFSRTRVPSSRAGP